MRALAEGECQGWTRAYDGLAYCVLADQLNRRGASPAPGCESLALHVFDLHVVAFQLD